VTLPDPTTLVDLHSHLVPGVDDGARTVEDVLDGVARMTRVGIRCIVTTPHLEGSLTLDPLAFRRRMEEMDRAWEIASAAVRDAFPEVSFFRGHEVMLDTPEPDLDDPRLQLGGGGHVLVEWPRLQVPPGTVRVLKRLADRGVRPVIAHPERYHGLDRDLTLPRQWRQAGALLQVNHGSLVGRYGVEARNRALAMLRSGDVAVLSTDFHGRRHLELYVQESHAALLAGGGEEQWILLTKLNPRRILEGESVLDVPPIPPQEGFWDRVRTILRK